MILKFLLLPGYMLAIMSASSQTCQNPSARMERIRLNLANRDSAFISVKNDLEFIQFEKHDTIADIGSYDGYYPTLYSIFSDSVVFYLNDITANGFKYFDSIQTLALKRQSANTSNTFKIVIGNDTCTLLPNSLFSKIILRDALHHFKQMDKMLFDIKRIMKSTAESKLILFEPIRRGRIKDENLCKGAMTRDELINLLDRNGFSISKESELKEGIFGFEFKLKTY